MRLFFIAACTTAASLLLLLFPSAASADTTGLVRGTVLLDGKPAAGVLVELRAAGLIARTRSSADGAFVFPRVSFGRYSIDAQNKRGNQSAQKQIDVSSDAVVTVSLAVSSILEIGSTHVNTSAGTSGAPVSIHTIERRQIATLPANNSLNSLIETSPGIVPFSYNEPVAHGFHGITYEIDGAPLPQSTSSNFAEIIDPHSIDSLEVFTGAIPAEFGGNRIGAVVNVISDRATDLERPSEGAVSLGAGSYGAKQGNLSEAFQLGASRLFVNANAQRSDRGLDSPTFVPNHDSANQADQFIRFITPVGERGSLAVDLSNQQSTFQIPTNTTPNPNDPILNAFGTDDVQREYSRFANVVFTENTPDNRGYYQIIPWVSYNRIAYDGDLAHDIQSSFIDASGSACGPAQEPVCPLDGLRQDRHSNYGGLRVGYFHASDHHALKFGLEGNYENFRGDSLIEQAGRPNFTDNVFRRGGLLGSYAQDKWSISPALTANLGLRYDRSGGFTSGNQLSPRVEVNFAPDAKNIVHFYYGRFYAAPVLEDTRCDAVVTAGGSACDTANLPAYDLRPEQDSYYEGGFSHTFTTGLRGSFNYWARDVTNVLDTTQIFPTPIFAVFNNAIGRAEGIETRLNGTLADGDSWYFSGTASVSAACGVSGSTFLFSSAQLGCLPQGLQPEDHDQTYTLSSAFTHRLGENKTGFVTLQPLYGSGYPVQFQNGPGRLPTHLTLNASIGREAGKNGDKSLGYALNLENLTGRAYLLKVNNGFNTTQWAPGFRANFRITAPTY